MLYKITHKNKDIIKDLELSRAIKWIEDWCKDNCYHFNFYDICVEENEGVNSYIRIMCYDADENHGIVFRIYPI